MNMDYGNELTGDLGDLTDVATFKTKEDSHWVDGQLKADAVSPTWVKGQLTAAGGVISFEVKVFAEKSVRGIYEGRIRKLFMYKGETWQRDWDTCLVNYDLGWDIEPHSPESMEALDIMLRAIDGFEGYIKDEASHA